jgi:hypothetical protein
VAWAISVISATGVLLAVLAFWPHTSPSIVHLKTRLFGPRFVYGELTASNGGWDVVLAGVRTGDPEWLRVAVDLHGPLDTHPGEEMIEAVATVVERNPAAALTKLLPVYGVEIVCGAYAIDDVVAVATAERRQKAVQEFVQQAGISPMLASCLQSADAVLAQARRAR